MIGISKKVDEGANVQATINREIKLQSRFDMNNTKRWRKSHSDWVFTLRSITSDTSD